jgi:DNA-binding response OmpR family regulator/anti-sigma regulatory factor (Ser/Thr protein kinase)
MAETILVIDDDKFILDMLAKMLSKFGYETIEAQDGTRGLEVAAEKLPDVILLDMMMPNIDGREVCERLKSSERTRDIPVIFVTAKTELDDQIMGLKIGAHDYIGKPIRPKELVARVEAALRVKHLQDQLKGSLRLQQELERTRQRLIEQYMSAIFGQLAESLVHELNNPLAAVIGFAELIKRRNLISDESVLNHIEMIRSMGVRASAKLSSLLVIAKNDGNKTYVNLNTLVSDVVELINARLLTVQVEAETDFKENLPEIKGSANQLARAVLALINNAVDAAEQQSEPSRRRILVRTDVTVDGLIEISVRDFGDELPRDITDRLSEPFFTTKGSHHTGLGLFLVKSVMEAHNGEVSWHRGHNSNTFSLYLPID